MYMNPGILLDALSVFQYLCPSKFITNQEDDEQNGEKGVCDIQTFCDHFGFQNLCGRHNIGHQLWLVSLCIKIRHLVLESLPQLVSGRCGVDASRAIAREAVRCKFGFAFSFGDREVEVGTIKFFASSDVLRRNELIREGRNFEEK